MLYCWLTEVAITGTLAIDRPLGNIPLGLNAYRAGEISLTGPKSRWRKCGAPEHCSRSDLRERRFWRV